MDSVNVSEARIRIADLVDGALHRGTVTVLRRYGRPVAAVVPMADLHLIEGAHTADQGDAAPATSAAPEQVSTLVADDDAPGHLTSGRAAGPR